MAHLRKPLAVALGLNTAVLAVETFGTFEAMIVSNKGVPPTRVASPAAVDSIVGPE